MMKYALPLIERHTSIRKAIQLLDGSEYDCGFVVNENGMYLGGIFTNDLRRLLISGVNEADEIAAYPMKYAFSLSEAGLKSEGEKGRVLADLRLNGVKYIPVTTLTGEVTEILSVEDLEGPGIPGTSLGRPPAKKILVVGGAGYLGSILTRKLLDLGYHVRVLDSFIYGRRSLDSIKTG